MRPRDSQRQRVYDMEEALNRTITPITGADAMRMTAKMLGDPWWSGLGIPAPDVTLYHRLGFRASVYWKSENPRAGHGLIVRYSRRRNYLTTPCHELAHVVMIWRYKQRFAFHGPQFVRVFVEALAAAYPGIALAPRVLNLLAPRFRVEIAPPGWES